MGVIKNDLPEVLHPFESTCIPEKFIKKAEEELNEILDKKKVSIKELQELIHENGISCRTTEDFLLQFLRARKYNLPKSLSLLKKYAHFKAKNQNVFTGMNYDVLLNLLKTKTMSFLPKRCPDGCAILAVHLNNWNPSDVPIQDFCRAIALFLYHSICDPMSQINGYKVLFDVKSHPLKHLRFCTPQNIYLLYNGTQECFPGRFKGIHVLNMSLTFKAAWTLIHPFLSEKLKKRIIFHQKFDTLLDHFPAHLLPADFGGKLEEYDSTPWLKNALKDDNLERLAN